MNRDERQKISFDKIINSKINSYIDACTGYGKTKVSGNVLKWMDESYRNKGLFREGNVIVPTERVKRQWELFLTYLNLTNIKLEIYIINGIVKNNVDLITNKIITIYDEIHLFPIGKEFGKIFELTNTTYRLGLSGTLGKKHKEALSKLKNSLKLIDTITIEEAEDNDWCAKTYTYNLFIDLNEKEKEIYKNITESFEKAAAYFESDFNLIRECNRTEYCKQYYFQIKEEYSGEFINENGQPMSDKEAIEYLRNKAFWALKFMQQRKSFIYESNTKIVESVNFITEFINKFENKVITFGQSITATNQICEKLELNKGIFPIAFHSKIKPIQVKENILEQHSLLDLKGKTMNMFKPVKLSGDKLADLYISMFNKGELNAIISAKSLEVGYDGIGILCGIEISGDSVSEDYKQRRGRSCRKEKITYKGQKIDKIACYVNIVLRGTKDEYWTKSKQYGIRRIKNVNSIKEIIDDFEQILDKQLI